MPDQPATVVVPHLYVLDPMDSSDCEAFLKVISGGAKIAAASATADRVVYVLLEAIKQ